MGTRLSQSKENQKKRQKSEKWTISEQNKYVKFGLKYIIKNKFVQVSWNSTKPNLFFPYMAQYIGTKDKLQFKSFDERIQKLNYKPH